MTGNFKFLFRYLDKINIKIDQNEFMFQMQSHPEYPSLLSIVDTLNFFNISNGVIHVPISELEFVPNEFILLLKEESKETQLYYVEKKGTNYYFFNGRKMELISRTSLESRWNNIVLFVERSEIEIKKTQESIHYILPIKCFILFICICILSKLETKSTFFFLLPSLGILLSIIALKELFGVKSELVNNFCNFTASTSCNDVIDSNKWKILKLINFSDLSIFLFVSQFFGQFIFMLSGDLENFFSIQKILLLGSLPIIFISLYYQKFIEKKWCPVCLIIILIVLLELGYLSLASSLRLYISLNSLVLFGLVFSISSFTWLSLKKLLLTQKELQEFQFKANRFMRNYEIFKNTLLSERKLEFPNISIILGNKESNTIITFISSPFCRHCKEVHEILEEILNKFSKNLKVQIILKTTPQDVNENKTKLFRSLYKMYSNDEKIFSKALSEWYENSNLNEWHKKYNLEMSEDYHFDEIIEVHNNWCMSNDVNYTPAIFINGYEYPKSYQRDNLGFFINELIEDNFLADNNEL